MVFKELVCDGIVELFTCMIIKYRLDLEKEKLKYRILIITNIQFIWNIKDKTFFTIKNINQM